MKKLFWIGIAALALSALAQAQTASPPAATSAAPAVPSLVPVPSAVPEKASVDAFGWIVGCWQAQSARDGSTINETWLRFILAMTK